MNLKLKSLPDYPISVCFPETSIVFGLSELSTPVCFPRTAKPIVVS